MLKTLDLFSGIGGFSLGLERTGGFTTVAFCEIEPFCRKVLAKHWPEVLCYEDVRELTGARLAADGIAVDVICGGFPCQDVSFAGKRAGLKGERSGLWGEYRRLIGEVRPRYVIVENVPGLLSLGMGTVLGELSEIGYDAVWDCVPASAIGAPHRRDRVWIVAHAAERRQQSLPNGHAKSSHAFPSGPAANAGSERWRLQSGRGLWANGANQTDAEHDGAAEPLAYCDGAGLPVAWPEQNAADGWDAGGTAAADGWWGVEPNVGRVAHGVPARVDRLRGLGNAVVPQIPEMIGRAILEARAA